MGSIQPETTAAMPVGKVRAEPTEEPTEYVDSTNDAAFADQSDQDNLLAYQQGRNAAAFTVLVERHQGMVFGIAQRMLGCPHAAEDVVQATFLVLAKNANKIRKTHSIVSWLYGVAYRISARSLRQRAKTTVSTLRDEVMISADPLEALNARFEQNAVFEELQRLREDLRAPMVLRYLRGKSNSQVAEELHLSESAVEGRLKRARKKLRLRLARKGVTFAVAIGLLAIVQREASAASLSTSATNIATSSLAAQALSSGAGSGIEIGTSNEAINLAEQEIFKMASIKVATFAVVASVVLGVVASGWAIAGDRVAANLNDQQASGVILESATASQESESEISPTLTLQAESNSVSGSASNEKPVDSNNHSKAIRIKRMGYYSSDDLSEGEIAIYEALQKPAKFDFYETQLSDIIAELKADYQMQIILDEEALSHSDVVPDELFTFTVQNVQLESALKLMLEKYNLTAIVSNEVLLVTSMDRAQDIRTTRVYGMSSDWPMDSEMLMQTIGTSIDSAYWESNGGSGTMSVIEGGLVISATHEIHNEINSLLKQLDQLYPKE